MISRVQSWAARWYLVCHAHVEHTWTKVPRVSELFPLSRSSRPTGSHGYQLLTPVKGLPGRSGRRRDLRPAGPSVRDPGTDSGHRSLCPGQTSSTWAAPSEKAHSFLHAASLWSSKTSKELSGRNFSEGVLGTLATCYHELETETMLCSGKVRNFPG